MTAVKVHGRIDILRLPVNQEERIFPPWHIKYTKSHILHSKCSKSENGCNEKDEPCQFCIFSHTLELPHMPDMVFPNNILTLHHEDGATLQFNALDALKTVSNGKIHIQLACAEAWKESRSESSEFLEEKIKPFDWTFTTSYTGTISDFKIEETSERIDMDKLKRKDKILFYNDLTLFEDELHDNGIAVCSVKIRVMPNGFFILLRYFLRIDNVLIRINDTRIYHEFGQDYLLREYTTREAKVAELRDIASFFTEPSEIAPYLPLTGCQYHKLIMLSNKVASGINAELSNETVTDSKAVTTSINETDNSVT
ncbi:PREDICTED: TIP41-like protein [Dufourea novaeangliae]|uniref:TIP41-like protein n=1 Tax=Dufourea novaeangliae TaxID=178035 RepID=A0A154P550_DUFNO|nr:PREDICTED: TIP41-like protein [Dufourea novaeangliae]KZC06983.1 TIP41-like protein [Dufourea novaeangliae]